MADTENSIVETQGVPSVELLAEAVDTPVVEQDVEVFGMTETAVDKTLTISDCAADAKATGDAIADLAADISDISEELDKKIESVPDVTGATEQEAGAAGLAPAPAAGDQNKYLKGDGTWADVPDPQVMTGATAQEAGTSGLTPVPASGDQGKFLKGDGTWSEVPDPQVMTGATAQEAGTSGLTPVPAAGDQGKFLKGDGTWETIPGTQVMTGATAQDAGASGLVPAPAAGDQVKYLKGDGTWDEVPDPQVMTGATASAAGTSGLVPAPAIAEREMFLCGDGTWTMPEGGKLVSFELDTVTNTSGSYTHTTVLADVTHDMKAVMIEVSNPDAFNDQIHILTADGSVTLTCDDVAGTSEVTISCLFVSNPSPITSSEFDVLANRIGTLASLQTTAKSDLVSAINETVGKIGNVGNTDLQSQVDALNSNVANIGNVVYGDKNAETVSVPANDAAEIGSITLSAGAWLIISNVDWAANNNGYRQIMFNATVTNPARYDASTVLPAGQAKETYQQHIRHVYTNAISTYKVYAHQTSGGALNAFPYIVAIRLSV